MTPPLFPMRMLIPPANRLLPTHACVAPGTVCSLSSLMVPTDVPVPEISTNGTADETIPICACAVQASPAIAINPTTLFMTLSLAPQALRTQTREQGAPAGAMAGARFVG